MQGVKFKRIPTKQAVISSLLGKLTYTQKIGIAGGSFLFTDQGTVQIKDFVEGNVWNGVKFVKVRRSEPFVAHTKIIAFNDLSHIIGSNIKVLIVNEHNGQTVTKSPKELRCYNKVAITIVNNPPAFTKTLEYIDGLNSGKTIKFRTYIPLKSDLHNKLRWLEGYVDGAKSSNRMIVSSSGLQIICSMCFVLRQIRELLNSLACRSKIFIFDIPTMKRVTTWGLSINIRSLHHLRSLGFNPQTMLPKCDVDVFVTRVNEVSDMELFGLTFHGDTTDDNVVVVNGIPIKM
jgi:hypothetical protein